ncbi:MAG: stage II sporulation protein D [Clostridiales bacterium GWB2_37_7]|nr:MAG: stage II sporulation protein D [Clostridiales bacterium GWB2_37_7]
MRRALVVIFAFVFIIFALPLIILKGCQREEPEVKKVEDFDSVKISVFNVEKNQLQEMDLEEYILGVLAAEMPSTFQMEALKAQALAARTYTLMKAKAFGGAGCDKHPNADICTDFNHSQAYKDPKSITYNYEKYAQAVLETKGEVIVYDNTLIQAVFHSTSGGKTENSEEIWSNKVPYLRSVISEYEDDSPKLVTNRKIEVDDFIAAMKKLNNGIKLSSKNIKNQIKILDRSEGGRITRIEIGGEVISGSAVRGALGLNSSNFSISYDGNTMQFTVLGNGHGVGLSQYGADGMAKNGSNYKEIIKHYYQGVEIVNLEELTQANFNNTFKAAK